MTVEDEDEPEETGAAATGAEVTTVAVLEWTEDPLEALVLVPVPLVETPDEEGAVTIKTLEEPDGGLIGTLVAAPGVDPVPVVEPEVVAECPVEELVEEPAEDAGTGEIEIRLLTSITPAGVT